MMSRFFQHPTGRHKTWLPASTKFAAKRTNNTDPERKKPGKDIDITEPSGIPDEVVHGGIIAGWQRLDRHRMRGRMTNTLLIAVLALVVMGFLSGVLGVAPAIIGALAAIVARPLTILYRYYFHD